MNRTERIEILARQNKRKRTLPVLHERLNCVLGYELPEEAIWSEGEAENATERLWESWRNTNISGAPKLSLKHLPEDYVVANRKLFVDFSNKIYEQEFVLYLSFGAGVHFSGRWCVSLGTDAFSHVEGLAELENKAFYVSSRNFDNYFLLDLHMLYFWSGDCRLVWELEVWGAQWGEIAHAVFAPKTEP